MATNTELKATIRYAKPMNDLRTALERSVAIARQDDPVAGLAMFRTFVCRITRDMSSIYSLLAQWSGGSDPAARADECDRMAEECETLAAIARRNGAYLRRQLREKRQADKRVRALIRSVKKEAA